MKMGLTFSLAARPRQTLALKCKVCHTYMDPSDDSLVLAKLFGNVKYAICAGCGTEVDKGTMSDRNYRARWTRRVLKLKGAA